MCGIAGIVQAGASLNEAELTAAVRAMIAPLNHRGPDADGVWVCPSGAVGMGHKRLAILDLSPEGAQPMHGPAGRYAVVFNGEIYNYQEIKRELVSLGFSFRGHSDTEVLVSAFECWGVSETLEKLVGMFAFAAWDRSEHTFYLARDRMGEKPLYYGLLDGALFFCSELTALKSLPMIESELVVSQEALSLYMQYGYVPDPYSIYENIYKLPPGSLIILRRDADIFASQFNRKNSKIIPVKYWDALEYVQGGVKAKDYSSLSDKEVVSELDRLLGAAIEGQMIADVPLGAFLSGGIDSTTIVALMQRISTKPVKTFTIGFSQEEFNEARHAAAIAKYLGTDHTELYIDPRECIEAVPKMARIYDEPFADSSQVPTYLVAGMARRSVTVSLSGDAGDELFCGYNRYFFGRDINKLVRLLPSFARKKLAALIALSSQDKLYAAIKSMATYVPKLRALNDANISLRMARLSRALATSSTAELYRSLVSNWADPSEILANRTAPDISIFDERVLSTRLDSIDKFMLLDLMTYLPGDNLVKVDRAAMAHSLETRVPMLDRSVVEFALSLPLNFKYRNGSGKWILREVLYKHVPRELVDRPKMGFSVPIADWLATDLRDWAEDLLSPSTLGQTGAFDIAKTRAYWSGFLGGRKEYASRLWPILMFQSWRLRAAG